MTQESTYDVQVCLRPFTPQEVQKRQQEIIGRVETLAAAGLVSPSVVWWSPKVCPPDTDSPLSDGCPDVVRELLDRSEREGFSLEPFIKQHAGIVPGEDDSLVLPVISLVVRQNGKIGGLYPVALDGERYTVEDGLRALESDGDVLNLDR